MENEIWKPVKNHEDYYEISSKGNIRSKINDKMIVGDTNSVGYRRVTFYKPKKERAFVHRLVALHFVEGEGEELVVNHIDGCKTHNSADNLEWVTRSENDKHAFRLGLRHPCPPKYKKRFVLYNRTTGDVLKHYNTSLEAANDLNTDRGRIYARANRDQRFGENNELGLLLDSTKTIDDLINSGILKTESDPVTPYDNIDKN